VRAVRTELGPEASAEQITERMEQIAEEWAAAPDSSRAARHGGRGVMRVLEKRLRRLEVGLLPPVDTASSRRVHQIALDIRRSRAKRLGLPEPDDVPASACRPGMSLAEMIVASRVQRGRDRHVSIE